MDINEFKPLRSTIEKWMVETDRDGYDLDNRKEFCTMLASYSMYNIVTMAMVKIEKVLRLGGFMDMLKDSSEDNELVMTTLIEFFKSYGFKVKDKNASFSETLKYNNDVFAKIHFVGVD